MKIEPIAWAMTDHQADGPNTQYTRLSQAAKFWAANGVEVEPFYDQQAIDTMRAEVGRLRTLLADWHSQSTCKDGLRVQSPGHAHGKIGVWDDDNGAFAGVECAQCRLWAEAAAIDAAKQAAE